MTDKAEQPTADDLWPAPYPWEARYGNVPSMGSGYAIPLHDAGVCAANGLAVATAWGATPEQALERAELIADMFNRMMEPPEAEPQ